MKTKKHYISHFQAGCVHFPSVSSTPCDIKVLILLYTAERRAYLGLIPNDQVAFVDRLRKVIQQQKSSQALNKSQQGGAASTSMGMQQGPSGMPNTTQQLVMPQTNAMAMAGGQITQNVVTSSAAAMLNRMRMPVCCICFRGRYFIHSFLVTTARYSGNFVNAKGTV